MARSSIDRGASTTTTRIIEYMGMIGSMITEVASPAGRHNNGVNLRRNVDIRNKQTMNNAMRYGDDDGGSGDDGGYGYYGGRGGVAIEIRVVGMEEGLFLREQSRWLWEYGYGSRA